MSASIRWTPVWTAVLLFVASRLIFLSFVHPVYLFNTNEELYRGSIARDLVTGLHAPLYEYRADDYSGGSLVTGVLASVTFRLFGSTAFALKLVPVLFFAGALACWMIVLQRYFSELTAYFFALFYILSPPFFMQYSITAMGYHSESIFFTALTLLLIARIVDTSSQSPAAFLLLGLVAGFSLWFTYIYAVTLVTIVLVWLLFSRHLPGLLQGGALILGFLIGFAPWIVANFWGPSMGLIVQGHFFWQHFSVANFLQNILKAKQSFPYLWATSFSAENYQGAFRLGAQVAYLTLFAASALLYGMMAIRSSNFSNAPNRGRTFLIRTSIAWLILFAAILQVSDLLGSRYRVPLLPFLFFAAAVIWGDAKVINSRAIRRAAILFIFCWIVVGLVTYREMLTWKFRGMAYALPGYSVRYLLPSKSQTPVAMLQFYQHNVPQLPEGDKTEFEQEIASDLAREAVSENAFDQAAQKGLTLPGELKPTYFFILGTDLFLRYQGHWKPAFAWLHDLQTRVPSEYAQVQKGFFYFPMQGGEDPVTTLEQLKHLSPFLTPGMEGDYWRLLGYQQAHLCVPTGRPVSLETSCLEEQIQQTPPDHQNSFIEGIGAWLLFRWYINPLYSGIHPNELQQRFPPSQQEALFRGAGMEFAIKQAENIFAESRWLVPLFTESLTPQNLQAFFKGENI